MINNDSDELLSSPVAKAIAVGLHNPFDKKTCSNCKFCAAKGEIKYYCGQNRASVTATGGCSKFGSKEQIQ